MKKDKKQKLTEALGELLLTFLCWAVGVLVVGAFGVDFESDDTSAEGEAGISIRIGTLLAVGFTVAVPALRWFLKWNKQKKISWLYKSHIKLLIKQIIQVC